MEVKRDRHGRPRVYLEEDCPVQEISIESQRERGSANALPPLYFLHIWWARRPLTVSRAAVLGSLLPAGYDAKEFLRLMGIEGDPIHASRRIERIHAGVEVDPGGNLYGYKRAFSNSVPERTLGVATRAITSLWGTDPQVLDSFAGGGSIPFEACRMGLDSVANELNPVASVIQRATIEYPLQYGASLEKEIVSWGKRIEEQVRERLSHCYPHNDGETELDYIWVRTVRCAKCGLTVPLAPNWWLDTHDRIAFIPVPPKNPNDIECSFTVGRPPPEFNPATGSIKQGIGTCPRCGQAIEEEYIKKEAVEGRLGNQLAAVMAFMVKGRKQVKVFREVSERDLEGVVVAERLLKDKLPGWQKKGLLPDETRYIGPADRSAIYGITRMRDMFSPRQLLVHLTTLEIILDLPWDEVKDSKKREALRVYIQFAFDKCIDWNSTGTTWSPNKLVLGHTFQRHDFAIKWSYGEIDGAGNLFRFGYGKVGVAYRGLSRLLSGATGACRFINGDAADVSDVKTDSINLVCIDPPYYDNVMYSECSDFFYVWMKRGLGDVFPSIFQNELTDKDRESVANVSRFKEAGSGKARDRASRDYEAKMQNAFREMHRVLKDDGVMTIMFTHKSVDAWDVLAYALLEANFEITASWPIHTESEHSMHQKNKNAAASTILLVCRKRPKGTKSAWWEELQLRVDEIVKAKAERFAAQGLRGQDMLIACFGPALEVISEGWPVKKKDGTVIRPDEALDRARTIMSSWLIDRIAEGKAESLDPRTRFYILLWHLFGAREVSFDEARKLGISLKVEIEDLLRSKILEKRGQYVRILKPEERSRAKGLRPDAKSYDFVIDYIQAAMHAYESGQSAELNRFHQRTGALAKEGYREAIALLLDVLPRTAEVVEYGILDQMWESNYRDQVKRKPRTSALADKKQTKLEVK